MKRRNFIKLIGVLSLGGAAAALWRNLFSFWLPRLNDHVVHTMTAVIDLMFPGDGLPGAAELGIHHRILAMTDFYPLMSTGITWLDGWAVRQGAADFLALGEAGRRGAIDAAFASNDGDARKFVTTFRFFGGLTYYNEPVIKTAFSYTGPPQPDGFADFQDPPNDKRR